MSESCKFCSVYPRNPCRNREEASDCPNCEIAAAYLDFDKSKVVEWLRYQAQSSCNEEELKMAANLIEEFL